MTTERIVRIPAEDPEAVMRRDRVPRRGGRRAKHRASSFWDLVNARRVAAEIPPHVAAVLDDPATYGHRFTPLQARVLTLKYANGETYPNASVAAALGTTTASVYSALRAAEREARVLVEEWTPIRAKLAAGATRASLPPEELRIHERCRKPKEGKVVLGPMSGAALALGGTRPAEVHGRPLKPFDETEQPGGQTKEALRRAWDDGTDRDPLDLRAAEERREARRAALKRWGREAGTPSGEIDSRS
jgi:hypothetical protein